MEVLICIVIAGGLYWAWKFYHKDDKPIELFTTPTIKHGGPARNSDGSFNWESDELVTSPGDRLAMLDEALGKKRRCPKCGSRLWTKSFKNGESFKDMIHCWECQTVATDDPDLRKEAEDAGMYIYHLAEFDLRTAG